MPPRSCRARRATTLVELIVAVIVVGLIGSLLAILLGSQIRTARTAAALSATFDEIATATVYADADVAVATSLTVAPASCDGRNDAVFSTNGDRPVSWVVRDRSLVRVACERGEATVMVADIDETSAVCAPAGADSCARVELRIVTGRRTWTLSPSRGER